MTMHRHHQHQCNGIHNNYYCIYLFFIPRKPMQSLRIWCVTNWHFRKLCKLLNVSIFCFPLHLQIWYVNWDNPKYNIRDNHHDSATNWRWWLGLTLRGRSSAVVKSVTATKPQQHEKQSRHWITRWLCKWNPPRERIWILRQLSNNNNTPRLIN